MRNIVIKISAGTKRGLQVRILQVGDFAGWNFAGCQELCSLMMQT
jgi:hypothetical protein